MLKNNKCIDCDKEIGIKAKRCNSCSKSGKNHPMYKVLGSDNHKWKGGLPKCIDCGKQLSHYENKRCHSCATKNKYNCGILNNKGKNNPMYGKIKELCPNWNGGSSFEPYPITWTIKFKELIRERDNHTCQLCDKKQEDCKRKLDTHHIDYDKENLDPNNLISLCKNCHMKTNFNRDFWKIVLSK